MLGTDHYVYRKDGRVYLYRVGRGEPVIFLHNFELSGYIWAKALDRFAQHFTCYNIDLPGHDRSDIPPRTYWLEDYARAIVDVLDACGIERAHIVGSHGGCVVGIDMAVAYPNRVNKLVFDGLPYWNKERGRTVFEKWWMPMFTDTTSYDVPVIPLKTWEEVSRHNPHLERDHWERQEEIARKSRRWIRDSFQAMTTYDVEAAGPRVKAPTLLIYGERDALRRGEQRAKEGIKSSTLVVVPGVGAPHNDSPDEFVRLAHDFLQKGR
ncbi:MAG: alpha/beta hydrolase [Chloroflexi bacterium]|nr:alpha/beta hydrolase [Chloroflexota bacterium]